MLNIELGTPFKALSSFIETEPWGFDSEDKFLNAAVLYELELPKGYNAEAEALMILEICKDIERRLGRKEVLEYDEAGERIYHNRPIDIDILLAFDALSQSIVVHSDILTIPHPKMFERPFVMVPLQQIYDEPIELSSIED